MNKERNDSLYPDAVNRRLQSNQGVGSNPTVNNSFHFEILPCLAILSVRFCP